MPCSTASPSSWRRCAPPRLPDEPPLIAFETQADWEAWLSENHSAYPDGIRMKVAKKGSGIASITHPEALDVALCFGWIDGQARRIDEQWFSQRWLPRRKRSIWSRINREKAEALIAAGRMRLGGLAEVERAKADGRWDAAYEPASTATVPDDLRAALDAVPAAAAAFEGLNSQNRYAILHRVAQPAKKPGTRERRIAKYVAMLAAGETLHP
jgi:uncharacterized protein YdeI (YjbR/CyaY-like superfamily)